VFVCRRGGEIDGYAMICTLMLDLCKDERLLIS